MSYSITFLPILYTDIKLKARIAGSNIKYEFVLTVDQILDVANSAVIAMRLGPCLVPAALYVQ
jgi:hypothetical protein